VADDVQILANNQSRKMTYRAGIMFNPIVMHDLELPEYKQSAEATLDGFERANKGVEALASLTPAGVPLFTYKTIWGKNLLGRELSGWERFWSAVEVASWTAPPVLAGASEFAGSLRHANDVVRYADDAAAARKALEAASDVAQNRRAIDVFTENANWRWPANRAMQKALNAEYRDLRHSFDGTIKWLDDVEPPPHPVTGKPMHGSYHPVTKTITLYKGADSTTLVHELRHWKDAQERIARWGFSQEKLASLWSNANWRAMFRNQGEGTLTQWMLDWGFTRIP